MSIYDFRVDKPFSYNWAGKFEAPDENWIHMTRELVDYELILMTEGILYIAASEKEYTVKKGEYALLVPPCHQFGLKPSKCSFYWVHFSYNDSRNDHHTYADHEIQGALPREEKRILLPDIAKIPGPDRMIVQMKQLQDCDRKYQNRNQNSFLLTAALCELYSQLYLPGGAFVKQEHMQLYTDIVDYISWRIRDNIRVSEIAAYFGYNEKYITTFFKRTGGTSLKSYILNRKMELAKAMLTDTNLPIAQIGYDIGFSDNHNFSSAFKKVTGQSPSGYRNTYSQRQMFHQ